MEFTTAYEDITESVTNYEANVETTSAFVMSQSVEQTQDLVTNGTTNWLSLFGYNDNQVIQYTDASGNEWAVNFNESPPTQVSSSGQGSPLSQSVFEGMISSFSTTSGGSLLYPTNTSSQWSSQFVITMLGLVSSNSDGKGSNWYPSSQDSSIVTTELNAITTQINTIEQATTSGLSSQNKNQTNMVQQITQDSTVASIPDSALTALSSAATNLNNQYK
jgi:hypothetical protein